MRRRTSIRIAVIIIFILMTTATVWAKGPKTEITVTFTWRPNSQLTSLDTVGSAYPNHDDGDDYRYVDLVLTTTANVNFWTIQVTCQLNPLSILDVYTQDVSNSTPFDWGDDAAQIETSRDLNEAATIGQLLGPGLFQFTASKYGYSYPLGGSGYPLTQKLVDFRFRVKPQGGVFHTTVVPSCTASFLDLNGATVPAKVSYSRMPSLTIASGYSIAGNVTYQPGAYSNAGIGINCRYDDGGWVDNVTTTDSLGNFEFDNLRDKGNYECIQYGNVIASGDNPDLHLSGSTWVDLWQSSMQLLPTILLSGNTDRTGNTESGNEVIDNDDIALVTGAWMTAVAPTSGGDASGNGFIDKSDLAIVASSFGWQEYVGLDHWVGTAYPFGSYIQYLNTYSPHVRTLLSGKGNQYWPSLSPDGSLLAYVEEGKSGFTLFAMPMGVSKAKPIALTPTKGWDYSSAFAPAWSRDGTQIAFVCAYGDSWMYADSTHDICVVNADGTSLRSVTWGANLYPPTWLDDDTILYAGDKWDGQTLYMTDVGDFATMTFDSGLPEGSSMPQVTWYYNNGEGYGGMALFYVDGGRLYFADVNEDNVWDWDDTTDPIASFADISTDPSYPYHLEVKYWDDYLADYAEVSTNIDYYEIAYNRPDVIFTENFDGSGGWAFRPLHFDWDAADPTWQEPGWWSFPGQQGNPFWNGNPDEPTDLFGRRNTMDWTP